MTFLRVNGYAIPLAENTPRNNRVLGGDFGRAYSGNPLTDEHYDKGVWGGTTPPVTEMVAEAIRGGVRGLGQLWPLVSDGFSSKGLAINDANGLSFLAHIDAAGDGDDITHGSGLTKPPQSNVWGMAAPTRTNLLSQNQRDGTEDTTTTGFTVVNSATLTSQATNFLSGARGLQVDTTSGANRGGASALLSAQTGSISYTFSVYVKGAGTVRIRLRDNTNATESITSGQTLSATEWRRFRVSHTMGAGPVDILCIVEDNAAAQQTTFYIDELQLETFPAAWAALFTASPWVDGAITVTNDPSASVSIPVGVTGVSVSAWMRVESSSAVKHIWSLHGATASDEYIEARTDSSGVGEFAVKRTGQAEETLAFTLPNTGEFVTCSFRADPETGENALEVHIDGVLDASTVSLTNQPQPQNLTALDVGHKDGSTYSAAALSDLMLSPWAVPLAQHTAWHGIGNGGTALPPLSRVFIDGDAIPGEALSMQAEGHAESWAYTSGHKDGAFRENLRLVGLDVWEV